jgi:hypothetical protein
LEKMGCSIYPLKIAPSLLKFAAILLINTEVASITKIFTSCYTILGSKIATLVVASSATTFTMHVAIAQIQKINYDTDLPAEKENTAKDLSLTIQIYVLRL